MRPRMFRGLVFALALALLVPIVPAQKALAATADAYIYAPVNPGAPSVPYAFDAKRVVTGTTAAVTMNFDLVPLAKDTEGFVAFNAYASLFSYSSDRVVAVGLWNGNIVAFNNTARTVLVSGYTVGQSYRLSVVMRPNDGNGKFDVYVDGAKLATGFSFRKKITDIGVVGILASGGTDGFYVKNIAGTDGSAAVSVVGMVDNGLYMDEANNPAGNVYKVGSTHKFKKVQDALMHAKAGDVIEIDGDAVYPAGFIVSESQNDLTIRGIAINGKRPKFKTLNATNLCEVFGKNVTIDNCEFEGNLYELMEEFRPQYPTVSYKNIAATSQPRTAIRARTCYRGIFQHTDQLNILNCVIHDCRMGILSADQGSGSITVKGSDIYHNGVAAGDHNLYLTSDQSLYPNAVARVEGNYIHDSVAGNGLKTRSARDEVYYNVFENNCQQSLELIGPDPGYESDPTEGYENAFVWAEQAAAQGKTYGDFTVREDSDVVGNLIIADRGSMARVGGDGTSNLNQEEKGEILNAFGQTYGRYRFVNNTFVYTGSSALFSGIRVEFGVESVEVYNNLFYSVNGAIHPMDINMSDDEINHVKWASGKELIAGANNWIKQGAPAEDVPAQWINTIVGTDPGFVNDAAGDYHLAANSPLKCAGVPMSATVATWDEWTYESPYRDFYDPALANGFNFADFTSLVPTATLRSRDTSFPNPLMVQAYDPVDKSTMALTAQQPGCLRDIGAYTTNSYPVGTSNKKNANVQLKDSTAGGAIAKLAGGEKVEVLGEVGDWVHIRLADGTEGYVDKEYIDYNFLEGFMTSFSKSAEVYTYSQPENGAKNRVEAKKTGDPIILIGRYGKWYMAVDRGNACWVLAKEVVEP